MNRLIKTIFFALLAQWVLVVNGMPAKDDSLRFEVLLTSKMLSDIQFNETLINTLDITSNQLILLSSNSRFYLLGWGGIEAVGQKVADTISSFAYTPDGFLMIVHNKELCTLDSLGNLSKLFGLPGQSMGITAGEYVMYVYDRNKDPKKNALYVVAKGGKYAKLFEIPTPISSVVEMNNSLLVATGSALFSYNIRSKELKTIVALQKEKEIKSIAVDTLSNMVFFSTDNAIYALKDSSMISISDGFGGILRYLNNGLIVFNPEKKLLIRMVGIEGKIASKMQAMNTAANDKPATDILTNSAVITMVKTKLSDDLIVKIINKSMVNFNMGVDSMIFLSNQNVSSAVIMAMKNAMKRKTTVKNFYIIAGSYPTEQQANDAIADLKRKGFTGAEVVGKNSYGSLRIAYKVYATNEEAAKDLTNIKQTINPSAWIFEKK